MDQLFLQLYKMLGSTSVAIVALAALLWGIASILLSPCHLASIPLVVACVGGNQPQTTRRAALLSVVFASGILLSIALIGALTVAAGRIAGDVGPWGNRILGLLFILFGLNLCGLFQIPWFKADRPQRPANGLLGAFVTGGLLGVGLGPCTFAFLAPVMGIAFSLATSQPLWGATLVLLFAVGHCAVIALAGVSAERAQRIVTSLKAGPAVRIGKKLFGLSLLLLGCYYLLNGSGAS